MEIQRISEAAVHHLIETCQFDGIALHYFSHEKAYKYYAKMLETIKHHAEFAGKTLGFFSPIGETIEHVENFFKMDMKHNHQIASLVDEIHAIGDIYAKKPYPPKASDEPDDKYYASGITKDKYFTYGNFNYTLLSREYPFEFTKSQLEKIMVVRGLPDTIMGLTLSIYHQQM